jgi:hypothetical protein
VGLSDSEQCPNPKFYREDEREEVQQERKAQWFQRQCFDGVPNHHSNIISQLPFHALMLFFELPIGSATVESQFAQVG